MFKSVNWFLEVYRLLIIHYSFLYAYHQQVAFVGSQEIFNFAFAWTTKDVRFFESIIFNIWSKLVSTYFSYSIKKRGEVWFHAVTWLLFVYSFTFLNSLSFWFSDSCIPDSSDWSVNLVALSSMDEYRIRGVDTC